MALKRASDVQLRLDVRFASVPPGGTLVFEVSMRPTQFSEFKGHEQQQPYLLMSEKNARVIAVEFQKGAKRTYVDDLPASLKISERRRLTSDRLRRQLWAYQGQYYWATHEMTIEDVRKDLHSWGFFAVLRGRSSLLVKTKRVDVTRSGPVQLRVGSGSRVLRASYSNEEYDGLEARFQEDRAVRIGQSGSRNLWWAADGYYWDAEGLSLEEVELEIWAKINRRDAKFERIRKLRECPNAAREARRERIPSETIDLVYRRDDGRCVRCGAEEDLQVDHIIPVAKGGGNAPENLQMLCGPCNRAKSASIV